MCKPHKHQSYGKLRSQTDVNTQGFGKARALIHAIKSCKEDLSEDPVDLPPFV